jgi:hypothetical protein
MAPNKPNSGECRSRQVLALIHQATRTPKAFNSASLLNAKHSQAKLCQRPGPASGPFAGDPLPILFGGRYQVGGDRFESH